MESVADRLTVGDPLGCPRMLRGDTSQRGGDRESELSTCS